MAEEAKKEEEVINEEKKEDPKPVYKYTVTYLSNGFYNFEGEEIEAGKGPSIDQQHIMLDLSSLGHKVDHDIAVNDAVRQVIQLLQQASNEQAKAAPAEAAGK
jgi:hypothetical protein